MELTQQQDDYIFNLVDDWNRVVADKTLQDFVKDDLGLAIVTSIATLVASMMDKQTNDSNAAKIWGFIILGAFLHREGLLHIGENEVLQ